MKVIIKVIIISFIGFLGWLNPPRIILFAQQADTFYKFTTGSKMMGNLSGDDFQIIIPDFQVNENAGGSGKSVPRFGVDEIGNFVAAWGDRRDGYCRIFAQRFNRVGLPLGPNFRVDDEAGSSQQGMADVAVRENGDFVIVWLETNSLSTTERKNEIVARMFSGSGTALGKAFKVTEEQNLAFNSPFIEIDRNGNFMIVWQDERLGNRDIFAQRYDGTGSPLGENFVVNDVRGSTPQYPQIVAIGDGEFLVAWLDRQSGISGIYAQRYDLKGTARGPNFLLASLKGSMTDLALAANKSGDVVIIWDEWQDDHRDLYGCLYHYPDSTLSGSFMVNDKLLKRGFANQSVAVSLRGDFCVTWHGDKDDRDVIFARWFQRDGRAKGSSKQVNEGYQVAYHVMTSIVADVDEDYIVAWEDLRNGQPDIYAQRFDSFGEVQGTNFKMNDDIGSADQMEPDIAVNADGNFVVVWADYRESSPPWFVSHSNIYARRFNPAGTALGKDFKVNDDPTGNYIWASKVAIAPDGRFMVVWGEYRKGLSNAYGWDVYAQFFSAESEPVGTNLLVSADTGKVENHDPDIEVDTDGNFVIVWSGSSPYVTSNFFCGIFFQKYDRSGIHIGSPVKVAEYGDSPDVAMAPNGDFMVVWKSTDISAQVYNRAGIPQGAIIRVNQRGREPAVVVDGSGNYFIVWYEDAWELYARRFDRHGKALGGKFKINDQFRGDWPANLSVSADQAGNVLVVWNDNREGYWDIVAQRYDSLGQRVGDNFCPTQHTRLDQEWPSVQVVNGKIYLAWQTNHVGGTGYDIWANMLEWPAPIIGVDNMSPAEPLTTFSLSQNYPNPFNQSTKIQYVVSEGGPTTIKIYNLAGGLVRTLVNKSPGAGGHEIIWDGNDMYDQVIASGIYFYQIKSGSEVATRRMVLLR